MRDILKDSVDQSTEVRFLDSSGNPATGVNAATSGLSILYRRLGGIATSIGTITDLGSQDAVHSPGGIIHIGAGLYRVDLPDAATADGADQVTIIPSATNLVGIPNTHPLVEAIATGTGGGARTVTITVTDGTDPLESARVRMVKGAENYVGSTNASGQVVFNLDDGTWTVSISLAGYSYAGTTLVVNGTEAETYAMTLVAITPSAPGFVTGFFTTYDESGEPEAGVVVSCKVTQPPKTTNGLALDGTEREGTSDGSGLVEFPGLCKGATYMFTRANGSAYVVAIPTTATDTYALPSIIGAP